MKKISLCLLTLTSALLLGACSIGGGKKDDPESYKVTFNYDEHTCVSKTLEGTDKITTYEVEDISGAGSCSFYLTFENNYELAKELEIDVEEGVGYTDLLTPKKTGTLNLYTITGIKSDLVVTITSKESEVEEGWVVSFNCEHAKVFVYSSQDYTLEPVEATSTESINADTLKKTKDVEQKPQVNFKAVADEGYIVKIKTTDIVGTYNKLKNDVDADTNIYRITVIESDLTVNVIGVENFVDDPANGYKVTFVCQFAKVLVYMSQNYTTETPVEMSETATRDVENGCYAKYSNEDGVEVKPQVNFKVVAAQGYKVTIEDMVVSGDYNKFENKDADQNIYRITKIKSDLTITITAVQA